MTEASSNLLRLGVVIGTHGVRGDLKLRGEDPDFAFLQELDELVLQSGAAAPRVCRVARWSWARGNLLVRLAGCDSVESAKQWVGSAVLADPGRFPELPAGQYYWHQLRGLRAVDRQEGELGTLDHLFATAAHDIYVVNGRFGEVLIPAVAQFVAEVDLAGGRILFDLPEGLVPKNDDL